MFLSKPVIKPLGIDLDSLPVPEGSRNLYARAKDGRHIGIRTSGGVVEVRSSPPDGSENYFDMENILLDKKISHIDIIDPTPELFCNMLGLSVNGEMPQSDCKHYDVDLSGDLTYWHSTHLLFKNEVSAFVDRVKNEVSDIVISALYRDPETRKEHKAFDQSIDDKAERVYLLWGTNNKTAKNNIEIDGGYEFLQSLPATVLIIKDAYPRDATGKEYCESKAEFKEAKFKYTVPDDMISIRIIGTFITADEAAKDAIKTLEQIINEQFSYKINAVDLVTKETLMAFSQEEIYPWWASKSLIKWTTESPDRYMNLGQVGDKFCGYKGGS